ncbi:MAG: universal stress protein [Mycobacteriales bacterium]|nr:universal stress protein [Mycobacteriales bacterium]
MPKVPSSEDLRFCRSTPAGITVESMPTTSDARARSVVVGVDGSDGSRRALRRALWEAEIDGAALTLVHAWSSPGWDHDLSAEAAAQRLADNELGRAMTPLEIPDVPVVVHTVQGDPGQTLTEASVSADLLVVGRNGRSRCLTASLGATARDVVQRARCPVMVVPGADPGSGLGPAPGPSPRLFVGVDGSRPAERALLWALDRAVRDGSAVHAVHAWHADGLPALGEGSAALADLQGSTRAWLLAVVDGVLSIRPGCEPDVVVEAVRGHPTATLLARATPEDLLVVGTRGRGGFPGLPLGSVASQVVEHAGCEAVLVR